MAATDERVLLTQQSGRATPRDPPSVRNTDTGEEHGLTEHEKITIVGRQLEKAFGIEVPPPGNRGDPGDDLSPPDAETGYVPPIQDPYRRAIVYLERHNILQLFQGITADIVYKRPDDPIQFMIGTVEKLLDEGEKQRDKVARETAESQKTAQAPDSQSKSVKPDPATPQESGSLKSDQATTREITRPNRVTDSTTSIESTQEKSVSERRPGDDQPLDDALPTGGTGDDVTISQEHVRENVPEPIYSNEQPVLPASEPSVEAAEDIALQPAGAEPVVERPNGLPEETVEGSASAADSDYPAASTDDKTVDNNPGSEGEPKDSDVTGGDTAEPVIDETVPAYDKTAASQEPETTDSREITEDTSPAETNKVLAPAETNKVLAPAETNKVLAPAETNRVIEPAETNKVLAPAETNGMIEPAGTQQTNGDITADGTLVENTAATVPDTAAGVPDHTTDHTSGRHDHHEPAKSKTT